MQIQVLISIYKDHIVNITILIVLMAGSNN